MGNALGVPAKRFLDIEVALRWAYRDELPKRHRGRGSWIDGTSLSPAGSSHPDAIEDEGASREPGYPAALGEPHADALAIEQAVKGLTAWAGHGFGPEDAAGLMHGFEHMEIDHAQAGAEAVAAMPGTVAVHARAGTRPKWSRELPEPFPDRSGKNGKPKVLIDETFVQTIDRRGRVRYEPADDPQPGEISYREPVPCPPTRKDRYRDGAYCPLVTGPPRRTSSRSAPNTRPGGRRSTSLWANSRAGSPASRRCRPPRHGGRGASTRAQQARRTSTAGRRSCSAGSGTSRTGVSPASRRRPDAGRCSGAGCKSGPRKRDP